MKRANWEASLIKWKKIKQLLETIIADKPPNSEAGYNAHSIYLMTEDSDESTEVMGPCGYCEEYLDEEPGAFRCDNCPLYQDGYCSTHYAQETTFWKLNDNLISDNWKTALEETNKMLDRILEDERLINKTEK